MSIALYFGIKLKEDVGKLTKHIKFIEPSGNYSTGNSSSDFSVGDTSDLTDDLVANILIWVFTTVLLVVTIFFLETILWSFIIILFAALYWIFYRALKLVIYQGRDCRNDIYKSVRKSFSYTFLYGLWMYFVIIAFFLGEQNDLTFHQNYIKSNDVLFCAYGLILPLIKYEIRGY